MRTDKSAAIVQTDRFPVEWQEGDSHPPPGFDFAKSLLEELKHNGAESSIDELEEDYWEHTNWYFWLRWNNENYDFRVECSLLETDPPTWLVDITRSIGMLRALVGKGRERDQICVALQEATSRCVEQLTGAAGIQWMSSDIAIDRLYGQGENREPGGRPGG